jgi:predicted nucleotidyltransferase
MVSPEQDNTNRTNELIEEVYHCVAEDIGMDQTELNTIKQGLKRNAIDKLISNGWTDDELKDLFEIILHTSEENRVGVFGSMSRGKAKLATRTKKRLATKDSDIDIVVEAGETYPESVSLTRYTGEFSGRAIDIFIFKGEGAKLILGNEYSSVLWAYENPQWLDTQYAAIYERMYDY